MHQVLGWLLQGRAKKPVVSTSFWGAENDLPRLLPAPLLPPPSHGELAPGHAGAGSGKKMTVSAERETSSNSKSGAEIKFTMDWSRRKFVTLTYGKLTFGKGSGMRLPHLSDWMFVIPYPLPNAYVEILTAKVMASADGTSGKGLGLEGGAPLPLLSWEVTARSQQPMNLKTGSHQTLDLLAPWPETFVA